MDFIMNLIRRFFTWFWGKVLKRTGYRAVIDGEIIYGCGDCKYNVEMRLTPLAPMAHYCTGSARDSDGVPRVVWDPYDIPEFCDHRVTVSEEGKE